jgi:hypothetical protein
MSDAPERIWICHLDGFTDPGEPPLWELISEHAALPDDPCYLRADLHTAALAARDAEIADLKTSVIAFCGPWAAKYAEDFGLPDGHLHPTHYDILAKCGARMDNFTRADMLAARGGRDE